MNESTRSDLSCRDCSWCILEDYGYSNYTVEGTRQGCLLRLNPDFPAEDSFYGRDPSNEFALHCTRFKPGGAIHLDVDREEESLSGYIGDDEVLAYWLLILPNYTSDTRWDNFIDTLYEGDRHDRQQP